MYTYDCGTSGPYINYREVFARCVLHSVSIYLSNQFIKMQLCQHVINISHVMYIKISGYEFIRILISQYMSISARFELSAGSYIIIPATFETGAASNFMIRVSHQFHIFVGNNKKIPLRGQWYAPTSGTRGEYSYK